MFILDKWNKSFKKQLMSLLMLSRFSRVWFFLTQWTIACQASLSRDSPDKNTGVGCHILFQGIFPTQGLYPCFLSPLHCRQILLPLHHLGSHRKQVKVEPIKIARQAVGFFSNSCELLFWKIRTIHVKCGFQETLQKLRERKRISEYEEVINAPWIKKLRTE